MKINRTQLKHLIKESIIDIILGKPQSCEWGYDRNEICDAIPEYKCSYYDNNRRKKKAYVCWDHKNAINDEFELYQLEKINDN
jgi:hypothetical protein